MKKVNKNSDNWICKDCDTDIFVDTNMVMVKDSLWKKICDHNDDALCDLCMEKRIGRSITEKDFKKTAIYDIEIIPCNYFWLLNKGIEYKFKRAKRAK